MITKPLDSSFFEAVNPFTSQIRKQVRIITQNIKTTICIFRWYGYQKRNDEPIEKRKLQDDDSSHLIER